MSEDHWRQHGACMFNTICWARTHRHAAAAASFRAVLDEAVVLELRDGDSCGSLVTTGNTSESAVAELEAGFQLLEKVNKKSTQAARFFDAIAWEGGVVDEAGSSIAQRQCHPYPQLLWHPQQSAPCWEQSCPSANWSGTPWAVPHCTPYASLLRHYERVVYLHLDNHHSSPGHVITQLLPQLAATLVDVKPADRSAIYVHTSTADKLWFRQWLQLAAWSGIEQKVVRVALKVCKYVRTVFDLFPPIAACVTAPEQSQPGRRRLRCQCAPMLASSLAILLSTTSGSCGALFGTT